MNSLMKVLRALVLPAEITAFETNYLRRMNRIGVAFFALHVPVFALFAWLNDTGPLLATLLSTLVLAGPVLAYKKLTSLRAVSVTFGFTAMLMGGILVHVGQGPVQIEMHFYFFALLAMLALFGNPVVILTATVTVALHHLLLWYFLPASVFNYDAPIWVVLVHAAFVVLEACATCFIARSFFDNVIGLEKIVQARTAELDQRNAAMRLVLDNVNQGLLTIDREAQVVGERSAVVDVWLGAVGERQDFTDYLARLDPRASAAFAANWDQLVSDIMPIELCIDQLPAAIEAGDKNYRLDYAPIYASDSDDELVQMLVMITDITAELERQRLEREQREMARVFDRIMSDRTGFLEYLEEAKALVKALGSGTIRDKKEIDRLLHTLKGNSMIFGIYSLADHCHELETQLAETTQLPDPALMQPLVELWNRLDSKWDAVLGDRERSHVEIEEQEFARLLDAVVRGEPHAKIAAELAALRLEPTALRLARVAQQAQRIARRLNKGEIEIEINDQQLRLSPELWAGFWSAFIHVVRNAVDHGLEFPTERQAAGKSAPGRLGLSTYVADGEFVVEIKDDGRGIDWERVRDRARTHGLACESREDLVAAIFADGLTTSATITEFSGRGVGLGAIRDACLGRGGRVAVHSESGQGSSVQFRFPAAQMAGATVSQQSAA